MIENMKSICNKKVKIGDWPEEIRFLHKTGFLKKNLI